MKLTTNQREVCSQLARCNKEVTLANMHLFTVHPSGLMRARIMLANADGDRVVAQDAFDDMCGCVNANGKRALYAELESITQGKS